MPLFRNTERLVDALRVINDHREEISTFYGSLLRLQVQSEGVDKLREAFRASVSERRGASLKRGKRAVKAFDRIINTLVQKVEDTIRDNPEKAHQILFETVVELPNINQKIAAMFIKFLVVYLEVWPELLKYLYIPIDTVVLKMIRKRLKVYNGKWKQSPTVKNQRRKLHNRDGRVSAQYKNFLAFQKELLEITNTAGVRRILADELWFIGYSFCKEYPLCCHCWIRSLCQTSSDL